MAQVQELGTLGNMSNTIGPASLTMQQLTGLDFTPVEENFLELKL